MTLSLEGVARGHWYSAVLRVREAVNECGFVLEEHPFSGVMLNFRIELLSERICGFGAALRKHEVVLDLPSESRLRKRVAEHRSAPTDALLVVYFPDGDPDKTHLVPAIPG